MYFRSALTLPFLSKFIVRQCTSSSSIPSLIQIRQEMITMIGMTTSYAQRLDTPVRRIPLAEVPKSQSDLPRRKPSDSYGEGLIPLSSIPSLQDEYINFSGYLKIGRILEDLDTFAVWLSYKHCRPAWAEGFRPPYAIVTAHVDEIVLDSTAPLRADLDMKLSGNVSWAGTSSMETSLSIEQKQENGEWMHLLNANFILVARHPLEQKAAPICPLEPVTEAEKNAYAISLAAKDRRQKEVQESVFRVAPSTSEIELIHRTFLCTLSSGSGSARERVAPEGHVWMETTTLKNLIVCQPGQRNLYNKIFGGFVMNKCFELGWASAAIFCGGHPILKKVDEVTFMKSVEIGTLFFLSAQVVYSEGADMQVRVHAETSKPHEKILTTTNTLQITFCKKDSARVPTVIPKSYAESMLYLDGRRHYS